MKPPNITISLEFEHYILSSVLWIILRDLIVQKETEVLQEQLVGQVFLGR